MTAGAGALFGRVDRRGCLMIGHYLDIVAGVRFPPYEFRSGAVITATHPAHLWPARRHRQSGMRMGVEQPSAPRPVAGATLLSIRAPAGRRPATWAATHAPRVTNSQVSPSSYIWITSHRMPVRRAVGVIRIGKPSFPRTRGQPKGYARRSSAEWRPTPPRIDESASQRREPVDPPRYSRRSKRPSRRGSRPPRQGPDLSVQPGW